MYKKKAITYSFIGPGKKQFANQPSHKNITVPQFLEIIQEIEFINFGWPSNLKNDIDLEIRKQGGPF